MRRSDPNFRTTHWSVVLEARDGFEAALEQLCRAYWYPLYACVRRLGHGPHDAEDLVQEFFARLLQKDYLKAVAPERGRFRTFLIVALKRFLANEWDRWRAKKRGGGQVVLSLDTSTAECRYQTEPGHELSPDRLYDRRWALALLEQVMARLRREFSEADRVREFEQLKVFLTMERGAIAYAEIAAALQMTEGAARVAVHRLRRRFREVFREEIGHTVERPDQIEDELRHLQAVLAGA